MLLKELFWKLKGYSCAIQDVLHLYAYGIDSKTFILSVSGHVRLMVSHDAKGGFQKAPLSIPKSVPRSYAALKEDKKRETTKTLVNNDSSAAGKEM